MEEKLYYAYIVASRSRTLYVGFTSDLFTRVMQHRNGTLEGFTSTYKCTRLVWYERYGVPLQAIAREKQIKRWSRSKKITLIDRENPLWNEPFGRLGQAYLSVVIRLNMRGVAKKKQVSPLRFAPVEMTVLIRVEQRDKVS